MEKISCIENLMEVQEIVDKINDVLVWTEDIKYCCNSWGDGEDIRALRTGKRLFLTNTGIDPVEVSLPDPIPETVETYMNGDLLRGFIFNHLPVTEIYFNGDLVFFGELVLELPQYTTEINLRTFINENNPLGFQQVRVINNLIQPGIISGDSTDMFIILENHGEFQGISSGGHGMVLTSNILLEGDGWLKGAGGYGGDGISKGNYSKLLGDWTGKAAYDDGGPYINGRESPLWCNISLCGRHAYYNRFWKTGGGANSGAWVMSSTKSGQQYWNTTSNIDSPIWGDQGRVHRVSANVGGFRVRHGSGNGLQTEGTHTYKIYGGIGGNGGAGEGFRVIRDTGITLGTNATSSGSSYGHDATTGLNISVPSRASYNGEDGGHGGYFGEDGENGDSAGAAIIGSSFLLPGSVILDGSNTIGDIL